MSAYPTSTAARQGYGQDDQQAARYELLAVVQAEQDETVVDHAEQERPHERADDGAGPSEQAGPTQHDRRDNREFIAFA